MQVKPRFESYSILEKHPILKDDAGNDMCLTLIEVKLPDSKDEIFDSSYKFWTVISSSQTKWANGAVSYSDVAFWKSKEKVMFKGIINGFDVQEFECGYHCIFDSGNYFKDFNKVEFGLKTRFEIKRKQ